MDKMGIEIDPLQVVLNGSKHLHGVQSGISYYESESENGMSLRTLDAPLLSFGLRSPWPAPLDKDPNPKDGIHFLLSNNIWGTNYAMWYPFNEGDEDSKFRFELLL